VLAGYATYALRWGRFVKRVRVLVANHPRLMRELVMATIADQPDIEVVGEVQNEAELADIVEQVQPDVLIIAFDGQGAQVIVNDPFIDHDEHAGTRWTFLPLSAAASV
jgi:AmiR/NasT family two-component response regulator